MVLEDRRYIVGADKKGFTYSPRPYGVSFTSVVRSMFKGKSSSSNGSSDSSNNSTKSNIKYEKLNSNKNDLFNC